ncbi:MAG: TatD family hydrolase [Bacteroidota bacterium]
MTDSHAHIYSDKFKKDIDNILSKSFEENVNKIYMPNIDHTSIDGMLALEEKYNTHCFSMMGLHPCSVDKYFEKELQIVEEWLQRRAFSAVGEIGIDLYWDKTYFEQQQEAFRIQVTWAKKLKLPIVIHTRNSMKETLTLLEEVFEEGLTGVVHCFTGNLEDAERIIKLGFKLGIGGVATFKNGGLDTVIPHIGLQHILLETDSPYLAPKPHRGKRNEPSYIPIIAQRIAELKSVTVEEVEKITDANAAAFFHKYSV